jgi:uncharacterized phiE125 gp8 family phage protein
MAEPVSLVEAKAQLRKVDTSEDTLISALIVAAREWVENYTGHILVSRAFAQRFDAWGDYLKLAHQPVTAIGDVTYTDLNGDDAAYEAGVLWLADYPARVYPPIGATFPTLGANGTIIVEYTAGYADADVPKALKHAVQVLVGHFFEHRSSDAPIPTAVYSLCKPFRGAVMA